MTEWNVVLVVIALVGLISTVVPPILRLNSNIVKLTSCFDSLTKELSEYKGKNDRSHDKIWSALGAHTEKLDDHETRLAIIEYNKEERR